MHKAKIVLLEAAVRSAGAINRREAAQALGFQDAVDRVSIEMRQKVGHHEGQVIERKAGRTPQGADNGPLFFCCFPGQLMRAARAVLAVSCPALAPLADGAIAAGQHARGLDRTGDLGADRRRRAGFWVDRWHSGPPRPNGPGQPLKAPGVCLNRPTNLIPTMFRYQTTSLTASQPERYACCGRAARTSLELSDKVHD